MIKQKKLHNSYNKKSSNMNTNKNENFMPNSFISPNLEVYDLESDNLIKSPASAASHVFNDYKKSENTNSKDNELDEDSYDDYNSDDEYNSDNENKYVDKKYDENSYSTLTKNKDIRIFKMKNILEDKRKQMFEKEKEIKELQKYNSFLESVITDYENYNNSILEEKNKQKMAIKILSDHIREISRNINNDDYKLNHIKKDQSILLKELQNIRNEVKDVLKINGNESNNNYYSDISSDDISSQDEYM